MSRQESLGSERDSNDSGARPPAAATAGGGLVGGHHHHHHHPSASSSPVPPPASYAQQFPFVDPNVMAVTNTAATIAAVAASALQQITKAKSHHPHQPLTGSSAGHHTSSVNPALVAALGGQPLIPSAAHHRTHAGAAAATSGVPPHLAALLAGGSPVNAAASLHHAATTPTSIHSGIHQALTSPGAGAVDTKLHPTAAAAAHATASSISNALLPNMHSWTLEQLGKKMRHY